MQYNMNLIHYIGVPQKIESHQITCFVYTQSEIIEQILDRE